MSAVSTFSNECRPLTNCERNKMFINRSTLETQFCARRARCCVRLLNFSIYGKLFFDDGISIFHIFDHTQSGVVYNSGPVCLFLYRVAQKLAPFLYASTSPNFNRFSKLFHSQNYEKICNNTIARDPTTPEVCRYTTLWNAKCHISNNWKHERTSVTTHF